MESVLDPFGDYLSEGYLRNVYKEQNLKIVGHIETAAFEEQVHGVLRTLRRLSRIDYEHIKETHQQLFNSVYPWAGQDRLENAPHLIIKKAGYDIFARPDNVRRAAEHALKLASDKAYLREHPGEVFGYLAYSHPFLEGNGRTIVTICAELCRRAGFYITWETIEKQAFLQALTEELQHPSCGILDRLLLQYVHSGVLSIKKTAVGLRANFNREQ